jgi:hypothetical protein
MRVEPPNAVAAEPIVAATLSRERLFVSWTPYISPVLIRVSLSVRNFRNIVATLRYPR